MEDYSPNKEMEIEVQRIKDDLLQASCQDNFGLGPTFQITQIEKLTGSKFFSQYSMHPDFIAKKNHQMVEQLNLQKLANNNKSGLYYMMLVVQQKIGDVKNKMDEMDQLSSGVSGFHGKALIARKQTLGVNLMQKIKKSFILGSFSPFKQVDQVKQVMKDS
mmetsp:Transcript_40824/g.62251  ORF Transcript_40824/g.62251 Transcript_40824/m.62251 type:complete len:161 (+) Transcript_40824:848-1330(+)